MCAALCGISWQSEARGMAFVALSGGIPGFAVIGNVGLPPFGRIAFFRKGGNLVNPHENFSAPAGRQKICQRISKVSFYDFLGIRQGLYRC